MFKKLENFTRKTVARIKLKIKKVTPKSVTKGDLIRDVFFTIVSATIVTTISPEIAALSVAETIVMYVWLLFIGFVVTNSYTRRFAGNTVKQLVSVS